MSLSRRQFLGASAGAGAFVIARPRGVLAAELPSLDNDGTVRESRLFPGEYCVHTDMHNHSLFSDGDGQPSNFYDLMRESGVDAASLTDHTVVNALSPYSPCGTFAPTGDHYLEEHANDLSMGCQGLAGLNSMTWASTKGLADDTNEDGRFTAIAGFEWSSPTLGHINVWFGQDVIDPLATGGLGGLDDALRWAESEGAPIPQQAIDLMQALIGDVPGAGDGIVLFQDWLKSAPSSAPLGGGSDAIFGFNHPGREPSRFEEFKFDPALVDRAVSMELFNKRDDYLFQLTDRGRPSPLVACLDAGWRPGILGTSDEHGTEWGAPDDKGRGGLYVTSLTRAGIRDAMEQRRFFAARGKGIRFDATANGVRMGRTLGHRDGIVRFHIDLDRGPAWWGKAVNIQVLMTGSVVPTLVHAQDVTIPTPDEPVITLDVPIDVADGRWVVLRVTDPDMAPRARGLSPDDPYHQFGYAFVYSSPFYLDPDLPPPGGGPGGGGPPFDPPGPPHDPPGRPPSGGPGVVAANVGPVLPATGGGRLQALAGASAVALAGLVGMRTRQQHHHDQPEGV